MSGRRSEHEWAGHSEGLWAVQSVVLMARPSDFPWEHQKACWLVCLWVYLSVHPLGHQKANRREDPSEHSWDDPKVYPMVYQWVHWKATSWGRLWVHATELSWVHPLVRMTERESVEAMDSMLEPALDMRRMTVGRPVQTRHRHRLSEEVAKLVGSRDFPEQIHIVHQCHWPAVTLL